MSCEPNFYLPENVDIAKMRVVQEEKIKTEEFHAGKIREAAATPQFHVEPIDTKILPKFSTASEELKTMLSLENNDYLRMKYNRFLDHPPEKMFTVRLYRDLKEVPKTNPRPKALTGEFYDIHNKLAPTPTKAQI